MKILPDGKFPHFDDIGQSSCILQSTNIDADDDNCILHKYIIQGENVAALLDIYLKPQIKEEQSLDAKSICTWFKDATVKDSKGTVICNTNQLEYDSSQEVYFLTLLSESVILLTSTETIEIYIKWKKEVKNLNYECFIIEGIWKNRMRIS